ncbi:hypothetical protein P4B35_21665 [Pontiellaceae bacterium B12227]|nr:hypothetical protein [Pontiellaceae bacterium B12227]
MMSRRIGVLAWILVCGFSAHALPKSIYVAGIHYHESGNDHKKDECWSYPFVTKAEFDYFPGSTTIRNVGCDYHYILVSNRKVVSTITNVFLDEKYLKQNSRTDVEVRQLHLNGFNCGYNRKRHPRVEGFYTYCVFAQKGEDHVQAEFCVKDGALVAFTVVRSLGADINMVLKLLEVFSVNDVSWNDGSDMFVAVTEQLAKGVLSLPK